MTIAPRVIAETEGVAGRAPNRAAPTARAGVVGGAVAALAAGLLLAAPVATADTDPPNPETNGEPGARLELTIAPIPLDDSPGYPVSRARTTTLECHPPGGAHPDPDTACAVLSAADGDPAHITPQDGFCTMEYAPVEATATGSWLGAEVDHRAEYSNPCVAHRATRNLFAF